MFLAFISQRAHVIVWYRSSKFVLTMTYWKNLTRLEDVVLISLKCVLSWCMLLSTPENTTFKYRCPIKKLIQ